MQAIIPNVKDVTLDTYIRHIMNLLHHFETKQKVDLHEEDIAAYIEEKNRIGSNTLTLVSGLKMFFKRKFMLAAVKGQSCKNENKKKLEVFGKPELKRALVWLKEQRDA